MVDIIGIIYRDLNNRYRLLTRYVAAVNSVRHYGVVLSNAVEIYVGSEEIIGRQVIAFIDEHTGKDVELLGRERTLQRLEQRLTSK